jgi:hypothetical protein
MENNLNQGKRPTKAGSNPSTVVIGIRTTCERVGQSLSRG